MLFITKCSVSTLSVMGTNLRMCPFLVGPILWLAIFGFNFRKKPPTSWKQVFLCFPFLLPVLWFFIYLRGKLQWSNWADFKKEKLPSSLGSSTRISRENLFVTVISKLCICTRNIYLSTKMINWKIC